jgi:hypothetical protein
MILITPGSVTPVLSKMVSNVVRSSQAIWMTAEISPGLKGAEDSIDLGMLIAVACSMSGGLGTLSSRPAQACSLQSKYPYEDLFQGQQTKPSQQTMHGVRA